MNIIYMVIGDAGDGSNFIEWHRTMSDEKIDKMSEQDQYQSGDGVQVTAYLYFSNKGYDEFIQFNNITLYEDELE